MIWWINVEYPDNEKIVEIFPVSQTKDKLWFKRWLRKIQEVVPGKVFSLEPKQKSVPM